MEAFVKPLWDVAGPYLEIVRLHINDACKHLEPWLIILVTVGVTLVLVWIYDFLFQEESLRSRIRKGFFRWVRKLPPVKKRVNEEIEKTTRGIEENFNKGTKGTCEYVQHLPRRGNSQAEIMELIRKYRGFYPGVNWTEGKVSGTVYSGEDRLTDLMTEVYSQFAWSNPLHPDVFPDVRKMEAEVVRMTCSMFNGGLDSCGTMTSGGTESILLACKAYRDIAYEKGIKYPEMIVPHSVHAAFDKAAHFFRMKITHIPLTANQQVDVGAMKRAINKNTCVLVGSAPSFPHGIMDSIVDIAKLGVKYNIPVHVDSCLGGFLVPFMGKAGYPLEPFDFSVPGVTSISADTHKYGFAPKGSSVIMYSNKHYRSYQYFVVADWPGGIYATPSIAGSRAGAIIAACWATMMYMGEDGYVESTRKIIETTRYIAQGIRQIPNIFVYGDPKVSVVGIGSFDFNLYRLTDAITAKGWNLNSLQFPASVHICVTLPITQPGVADRFIQDVRDAVMEIMKDPKAKCGGVGAIYGMAQSIPDRSLVMEIASGFIDACYSTGRPSAINGAA